MDNIAQQIKIMNAKHFRNIKRILYNKFYIFSDFKEASVKQDMEEGFDSIITLTSPEIKIPIRIRKNEYLKYSDITIRSVSNYNMKTEIHKIREGLGDFYFYAWETENGKSFSQYCILDLEKFRTSGLIDKPTIRDKPNKYGDNTKFNIYSIGPLSVNGIIKVYENFEKVKQPMTLF